MADTAIIEAYCNDRLQPASFNDYAPNGLQVDCETPVQRIISGVTANLALIDAAIEADADLLLVHHGYFWRGEEPRLVGIKGRRIARLFRHNISVLAYHLPLDSHPELGNNRQLGDLLGCLEPGAEPRSNGLLWTGRLPESLDAAGLQARLTRALGRTPLHVGHGAPAITRLAWCTGAGDRLLQSAADLGVQAFVTGEISEPAVHAARELGLHLFAAGHHATERLGVQALGRELAREFGLQHHFIDIDSPV